MSVERKYAAKVLQKVLEEKVFFKDALASYEEMLEKREKISVSEYEKVFSSLEMRAENLELNIDDDPAVFVFAGIEEYSRKYLKK